MINNAVDDAQVWLLSQSQHISAYSGVSPWRLTTIRWHSMDNPRLNSRPALQQSHEQFCFTSRLLRRPSFSCSATTRQKYMKPGQNVKPFENSKVCEIYDEGKLVFLMFWWVNKKERTLQKSRHMVESEIPRNHTNGFAVVATRQVKHVPGIFVFIQPYAPTVRRCFSHQNVIHEEIYEPKCWFVASFRWLVKDDYQDSDIWSHIFV